MIGNAHLFKILHKPHISEKVSVVVKKNNTIVLKVDKNANKSEIKSAIQKLFNVKVESVNTLIIKGKIKRHGHNIGRRKNWKKTYVTLKKGHNLDFINSTE